MSFLIPNSLKHFQDVIELVKKYNPVYIPSRNRRTGSMNIIS